ncbi:hypothetical protein [Azospirillum sp.]|uniref:hypothetical protein n=1 Tax=Azospirillum sp. TaxID=34012 RepID=UPI002D705402|nr:hypothetical protein [Azospirillum sp.]HYD69070.1 hypothetical protein [Azospirillum sp.]
MADLRKAVFGGMVGVLLGSFSGPTDAQGEEACPKPLPLAIAEAGLRVHTQVMVRALMCKTVEEDRAAGRPTGRLEAPQGDSSHQTMDPRQSAAMRAYAALTERHRSRISDWEREIIAKRGLSRFDRWRTEAASDIARREGRMSYGLDAEGFCASARSQAEALMRMSDGELVKAVAAAWCVINPQPTKR